MRALDRETSTYYDETMEDYHMRIQFKVEEIHPGHYMVWDRAQSKSLLDTKDLMEACVYCCGLRAMHNQHNVMTPEEMYQYTQWRT